MATSNGTVTLRGAFPAGTKVGLYERTGDVFSAAMNQVKSAKVSKASEVSFDGLQVGDRFFVAGEVDGQVRARAVTAKGRPVPKPKGKPLATAAPGFDNRRNVKIVQGARSTKDTQLAPGFAHPSVGKPAEQPERAPRFGQEDFRGVAQRSATITGEAHPIDEDASPKKPRKKATRRKATSKKPRAKAGSKSKVAGRKTAAKKK